jgi:hypothetical protein
MTGGGVHRVSLDDAELWKSAAEDLVSAIDDGEIKAFGRRAGSQQLEEIPALTFALAKVLPLGPFSLHEFASDAPAYIECTPITGANDDARSYDELYVHGQSTAAWTSLVLRKDEVLQRRPRPGAKPVRGGVENRAVPGDMLRSDPPDTPLVTERPNIAPELLQAAIDPKSGDIIVRHLTRLSGRNSELIRELALVYRGDMAAELAPENHRYITAEKLAHALRYQDVETLRQRVWLCRKEVERARADGSGHKVPFGDLIQTRRPEGYRLNPRIRFVSINEIDPALPLLRRKQRAVR